jgi:hypothetical protein
MGRILQTWPVLRWLPFWSSLLVLACVAPACSRIERPDAEELKQLPLEAELPGSPPPSGIRYWRAPFRMLPYSGSYLSVIIREGDGKRELELWQNTWGDPGAAERRIVVRRGPSLQRLGEPQAAFDGTIISDVPAPDKPDQLAPGRGFTRPAMAFHPDIGYVLFACVCPDYKPGSVPLLPAFVVSKTGEPGTWKYLGTLKGEIADLAAKRTIWSDGGSLIRLDDGRWRIYLNGFGQVVTAIESASLDGPWRFLRDDRGEIRELLPGFPRGPSRGGCFPTVLRAAGDEWHLWLTDKWPPQSIWHFYSQDGLAWRPYGRQPEITRAAFHGRGIKCLRAYVDPDRREIIGLLSVWTRQPDGKKGWTLHWSRMPLGPPP